MANALILHSDLVARSDTTLAATNAAAGMGAGQLATRRLLEPFRASPGSTVIDISCDQPRPARAIVLGGLREDQTGFSTFTVAASNTALGNTDQFSGDALGAGARYGFDTAWAVASYDFEAEITAQFWRITLTATGSAVLDIGRLLLGPDLGMSINIAYPVEDEIRDTSERQPLQSGERDILPGRLFRVFSIRFGDGMTAADSYARLQRTLFARAGPVQQVGFILDPADDELRYQACIGRVAPGGGAFTDFDLRSRDFRIEEDGGVRALRGD